MKKLFPKIFIIILVLVFFWQFLFQGLLPIPSDTIIGLYHPFRDLYAKNYPNGVPFKNFLVTDPIRQQYPWKELAISLEKRLELPLWNPYSFSGTPLMANFQSGSFYIFNLLFFLLPFQTAWSLLIFLSPLLSGLFLYLYLNNFRLNRFASLIGAIAFSFSGFSISWLEWGTVMHVALWLPLILLSIDKIFIQNKKTFWYFLYIISLVSAFFAGHLQTFFYLFIISWVYLFSRWIQYRKKQKIILIFLLLNFLFFLLTIVQWLPTLQFILLSARNIDQTALNNPGWFIPWSNLIQFVVPDYFGNPATLNYWGIWNYAEFVGYVGIIPLIFAIFSMFFRHDRKTFFFGLIFFISLAFSFPTLLAKLPYLLNIPLINSSQPTRLLFITTFSLSVLASFGFDHLLRLEKRKSIIYPIAFLMMIFAFLWIFIPIDHKEVVISNLKFPTLIFSFSIILILGLIFLRKKQINVIICVFLLLILSFDLLRFGWKFTPFTNKNYLFPATKTTDFLKKNIGQYRIASANSQIFPPNFSSIYRIQSVEGYDPLYLLRYGELISAMERNKPDINPPFGFNRIITPKNYESRIMDLLGAKYILSLSPLNSPKLNKVFEEGKTIVYENKNVIFRVFFVRNIELVNNKNEAIDKIFDKSIDLKSVAIIEDSNLKKNWSIGLAKITNYSENKIEIATENSSEGFLVLTDTFYPIWKANIDGNSAKIYLTDYNFRGVVIPSGRHTVRFYNSLF